MAMTLRKKIGIAFLTLITAVSICGCKKKVVEEPKKQFAIIVKKNIDQSLYFGSAIEPISIYPVTTSFDGTLLKLEFTYGDSITKGATIAILGSEQLEKDFRDKLKSYLDAKVKFNSDKISFEGSRLLYNAGVNTKSTYLSDESTHYTTIITYYESLYALKIIMEKIGVDVKKYEKLTVKDYKNVLKAYQMQLNNLKVTATHSGVALYPTKDDSGDDAQGKKPVIGSDVKKGTPLLSIGDLTGYKFSMTVSEIIVNNLKVGLPVLITGEAFPGVTLHGKITFISSQADSSSSGSSGASFAITATAPNVPKNQRKRIRIGMSAKVQIELKSENQLTVPMSAIVTKNNTNFIDIVNDDDTTTTTTVTTGATTPDGLIVINGDIKPGMRVKLHD